MSTPPVDTSPRIHWLESNTERSARWHSESALPPPKRVVLADDTMTADAAYRLACAGTAMLWRGDFQNARQLLQAMMRRVEHTPDRKRRAKPQAEAASPSAAFNAHRMAQAQRARILGCLLIPVNADYRIPLRRAPDVQAACSQVHGAATEDFVLSLRELQGLIGAFEWRKKGVEIAALGARIHPYYGVFSPVRGEYLQLVANAPLPSKKLAFDIGTGTGVLAALLAKRGVAHLIATEQDPRALACAADNLSRLGYSKQVEIVAADLFPKGRAPLIVCNPPWLPARPSSPIEHAIYDPDSQMLRGFLNGLNDHLEPQGEGWLILSDLAEHLGLRSRADLLAMIAKAGLRVIARSDIQAQHPKASDTSDPLHRARAAEVTSLWRLAGV